MRYIIIATISLFMSATGAYADDLKLKFDRPAAFFEETFVLGNGSQGAIVYGNPDCERISLNDITFWSGEPDTTAYNPGAFRHIPATRKALDNGDFTTAEILQKKMQGHNSQYYQPLGNLFIDFDHNIAVTEYSRELDLKRSMATVSYKRGSNNIVTRYIASAPDSLIAINIQSAEPIHLALRYESPLPYESASSGNRITADGYAPYGFRLINENGKLEEKMLFDSSRGIHYRTNINAITASGTVSEEKGTLHINQTTDVTIYITIATNFDNLTVNPDKSTRNYKSIADSRSNRAISESFNDIASRHYKDYSRLFSRVSINLGESSPELRSMPTDARLKAYTDNNNFDPDLEELYFQYGRYLLISCSRTMGVPANLQGLWNESLYAPWRSNYTTNINLEENYWPAEVTNLSEMHLPLLSFIKQLPHTGHITAREYYGVNRGWCAGHNTDLWGMTCPVGHGYNEPMWSNWNMAGAWLASHIWQHYQFNKDLDFLNAYYPTLKGAAEFCLNWLVENQEGFLITSPSTSPENLFIAPDGSYRSTSAGAFSDIAMIRECLSDTRSAAMELGIDKKLIEEIDHTLHRLAPYKIGKLGQLQEWAIDYPEAEPQHRHQSHLYGLYPGNHITIEDTPELAKAAARTLEIKGDNTTGWRTGWRVNLLARLKDANKAYAMYRRLLRYVSPDKYNGDDARRGGGTYPNLLDAHAPFQIDGNFGGTAGVAEMLIQSTSDTITLLPSIPENWNTGYFRGLRAKGAFTINAEWKNGKITSTSITADKGGSTTMIINGQTIPLKLKSGETRKMYFK